MHVRSSSPLFPLTREEGSLLFVLLVVPYLVLLSVLLALADDHLAKFMHHFARRRSARLREMQVVVCLFSSQRDSIFNAILSDNGYNFFHDNLLSLDSSQYHHALYCINMIIPWISCTVND